MTRTAFLERDLTDLGVTFTTSEFERQFYTRELIALPRWVKLLFRTMPLAVVKPVSAEEVSSVLRYCSDSNIPVVPRGGGTLGLLGTVPKQGGIVLDLTGLTEPVECDPSRDCAHVPAGITCLELDRRLRKQGMTLKSYPSSAPSATLGGWIMGSGLGIGSLLYGAVFAHTFGGEIVLADGTRKSFPAEQGAEWLYKSEGRLAVLTNISLGVRKVPESASHHLASFGERTRLFEFVRAVVAGPSPPYSIEILDRSYLALLEEAGYASDTHVSGGGAVAIACEGNRDDVELSAAFIAKEARIYGGQIEDGGEREWENRFRMWRIKRAMPTMLPIGIYVPLSRLAEFYDKAAKIRKRPIAFFGQVVSPKECLVMALFGTDERSTVEHTLALHLARRLFRLALSLGGRPGGGVGVLNAPYATSVLGAEKAATLMRKKKELDPKGILNPGMGKLVSPILYHTGMAALSMVDSFFPWVDRGQAHRGLDQELAACVECGYCENYCPTRGPWVSSTPRGRVRVAREACRASNETPLFSKEQTEAIFSCTLCGRCRVDCSVVIDSPTMWVEARSRLVQKGLEVDNLKALAHVVEEHGNIAGKPRQQRHRWAERLPFFGDIVAKKRADLVYFVGCVTSFYPMVQDVARSFVQCLASAGVDFMLLGGEETCCGYPLISAGHLDKAVEHMKANIKAVRETGAPSLAVTCPGCYRMWKHEYERLTGESTGIEVSHSSEFLLRLIGERRIQLGEAKGRFTYHDPCDLGRVGGIYDAPRSVIKAAPDVDFVELEENREYAVCCGSGGDFLTSNQEASLAVARRRLDNALSVGAETVVTACPSCIRGMTMARMAAKMPISVQDITQFVWKAIKKQDGLEEAVREESCYVSGRPQVQRRAHLAPT